MEIGHFISVRQIVTESWCWGWRRKWIGELFRRRFDNLEAGWVWGGSGDRGLVPPRLLSFGCLGSDIR